MGVNVHYINHKGKDMEIEMKVDITFTEAEIVKILKEHMRKRGYIASKHKVNIGDYEMGHQMNSYKVKRLDGIVFSSVDKKGGLSLRDDNPNETYGTNGR